MVELDQSMGVTQMLCVRRVLHTGLGIEDGKDLLRRLDGSLHEDVHAAEHLDRLVEEDNPGVQRDETRGT